MYTGRFLKCKHLCTRLICEETKGNSGETNLTEQYMESKGEGEGGVKS